MAQKSTPRKIDEDIKEMLLDYRKTLQEKGINVEKMFLFGSYAKGRQKPWSDIDVAIISPDFGHDYFDERIMLSNLAHETSDLIEPHPLHPDDFNDRWSTLSSEVKKYGTTIDN